MPANRKILALAMPAAVAFAAGMAVASSDAKAKLYWGAAGLGMAAGAMVRNGAGRAAKSDFDDLAEAGLRRRGFRARHGAQGNVAAAVKVCPVSEY